MYHVSTVLCFEGLLLPIQRKGWAGRVVLGALYLQEGKRAVWRSGIKACLKTSGQDEGRT